MFRFNTKDMSFDLSPPSLRAKRGSPSCVPGVEKMHCFAALAMTTCEEKVKLHVTWYKLEQLPQPQGRLLLGRRSDDETF
jgi:hypothetical protein